MYHGVVIYFGTVYVRLKNLTFKIGYAGSDWSNRTDARTLVDQQYRFHCNCHHHCAKIVHWDKLLELAQYSDRFVLYCTLHCNSTGAQHPPNRHSYLARNWKPILDHAHDSKGLDSNDFVATCGFDTRHVFYDVLKSILLDTDRCSYDALEQRSRLCLWWLQRCVHTRPTKKRWGG